ncbi:MAG TPA: secretin N-terminal domain-containing protein [Candidatus Baltobacteraceae bacterium]|nr:secretin N-terminal domain-containing protein [Candidatus Baltobacteraceae bacterium]
MNRFGALLLAAVVLLGAAAPARITLDVRDATLQDVLALLAAQSGANIVADGSVRDERVSLRLHGVTFDSALRVIAQSHDLEIRSVAGVLIVGKSAEMNRRGTQGAYNLGGRTAVIVLAHAQAESVAKELAAALPDGAVVVADKASGRIAVSGDSDTLERARTLASAFDVEPAAAASSTVAYRLRYTKASAAAANLKGALADGSYLADDSQNAIVVTGDSTVQSAASRFIQTLDVAAPQVSFEVRVADVVPSTETSNVGIEFGGYDLSGQAVSGAAAYAFTKDSLALNARLNAMMSRGKAQILATPKLVTLNNKEADLLIGETYPVIFYDARMGGQQVQFVDVGVKLRLTPTIGADGSVVAEMHPEYSAIQTFVAGYPVIANRKIDSTLRVKDGETIVLGGLLREIDSETVTRVPWLADIPVIGKVFQNREHAKERDEIVFLITPHILSANH